MKLLAHWKFNLIPNPSPFWRREFKGPLQEGEGRVRLSFASKIIKHQFF
jgi:hypothetical protein